MTTIFIIASLYCLLCMIIGTIIAIATIYHATKLLTTKKHKRGRR